MLQEDTNLLKRNILLGSAEIKLNAFLTLLDAPSQPSPVIDEYFPLHPRGKIHLQLQFTLNNEATPERVNLDDPLIAPKPRNVWQ